MGDNHMSVKPGDVLTIDEREVYVTESMMVVNSSLACQICNYVDDSAIMLGGTIYWLCEYGHENKVVMYE
jgi:hypothetical protein